MAALRGAHGGDTTRRLNDAPQEIPLSDRLETWLLGPGRKTTGELIVACGVDALRISEVQPAGKGRMSANDWARGRGTAVGEIYGTDGVR